MPARPPCHVTRRSFLAASGLGTASLLVPGLWAPARAPDDWAMAREIVARIRPPTFPDRDFAMTRFGATREGKADCTAAIARRSPPATRRAAGAWSCLPATS